MHVGFTSAPGTMNVPPPHELRPPEGSSPLPGHRPSNAGGVGAIVGGGAGLAVGAVFTCGVGLAAFGLVGGTTVLLKALHDNAANRKELVDAALAQVRAQIARHPSDDDLRVCIDTINKQADIFAKSGRTHERLELMVQASAKRLERHRLLGKLWKTWPQPSAPPQAVDRLLQSIQVWNASWTINVFRRGEVNEAACAWAKELAANAHPTGALRGALASLLEAASTQPQGFASDQLALAIFETQDALLLRD